jgi:hypothetical protein
MEKTILSALERIRAGVRALRPAPRTDIRPGAQGPAHGFRRVPARRALFFRRVRARE